MDFTLTERMALFLKRYVEINIDTFDEEIKEFKEMNESDFFLLFNDWGEDVGKMVSANHSDTHLNIEMKLNFWEKNVLSKNNTHIMIIIRYGRCILSNFKYSDDYKETIDKLVKKFILCKCQSNLPKKDDWCEDCFPYVVTQENNCCICLENEGVWIKLLECNHILHSYCWYKTVKQNEAKCPLCRTINSDWVQI